MPVMASDEVAGDSGVVADDRKLAVLRLYKQVDKDTG